LVRSCSRRFSQKRSQLDPARRSIRPRRDTDRIRDDFGTRVACSERPTTFAVLAEESCDRPEKTFRMFHVKHRSRFETQQNHAFRPIRNGSGEILHPQLPGFSVPL
jgi:hypothetical protein